MKLFALFNGCYSDTRLVGIYSTQAKADAMARVFSDDASIQEQELDAHIEDVLSDRVLWFVRLGGDDGRVMECHKDESNYGMFQTDSGVDVHGNLYTHCWADDGEHAVKIASERRRVHLAAAAPLKE